MEPLLLLVHRIPYPPNKGDKIRSFNLLKSLAQQFRIYLGAFVDDYNDWQYHKILENYCVSLFLRPLNPVVAKIRSITGIFRQQPLSLPYYYDRRMQQWVSQMLAQNDIKNIMVFSSTMAQYVVSDNLKSCRRVADFVDVDSEKWLQYSNSASFPKNIIYKREAKRLATYEKNIANKFDYTFFVSKEEMTLFAKNNPECENRLRFYKNGVDTNYFNPIHTLENPFPKGSLPIVFTGAMNYWANIEAVSWFSTDILPRIIEIVPNAHFYIVGSNPSDGVLLLNRHTNITVTGAVSDIRPYMKYASVIVAPLRIARGIQNKVLEGMAMAKPIVATPAALEGIEKCINYKIPLAIDAKRFANECIQVLQNQKSDIPIPEARKCILENYNWEKNLRNVMSLFVSQTIHE